MKLKLGPRNILPRNKRNHLDSDRGGKEDNTFSWADFKDSVTDVDNDRNINKTKNPGLNSEKKRGSKVVIMTNGKKKNESIGNEPHGPCNLKSPRSTTSCSATGLVGLRSLSRRSLPPIVRKTSNGIGLTPSRVHESRKTKTVLSIGLSNSKDYSITKSSKDYSVTKEEKPSRFKKISSLSTTCGSTILTDISRASYQEFNFDDNTVVETRDEYGESSEINHMSATPKTTVYVNECSFNNSNRNVENTHASQTKKKLRKPQSIDRKHRVKDENAYGKVDVADRNVFVSEISTGVADEYYPSIERTLTNY